MQSFLVPHWGFVKPFALSSGSALRPSGPAVRLDEVDGKKVGNGLVVQEVNQILTYSGRWTT